MSTTHWTIEELAKWVAGVLAGAAPGGDAEAPMRSNRRVREVPDARTIRWYQTTGLVDRPAAMRGRIALYGRRHLAQIVAIKRLQAEGQSLAEIQGLLAGIGDEALERLAGLPDADLGEAVSRSLADRAAVRPRFWVRATEPAAEAAGWQPATPSDRTREPLPPESVSYAVRLGAGVLLVVDGATTAPEPDDLAAIQAASAPLIRELRRRGLAPESTPRRDSR